MGNFKILILSVILILFIQCKERDENYSIAPGTDSQINFNLYGKLLCTSENIELGGVVVSLLGDSLLTDTTDQNGIFKFSVNQKSNFRLQITDEQFQSIDSLINIVSDTTIIITLKKKYDFFPLQLGNYWKYDYYKNFRGGMTDVTEEWWYCSEEWEITEVNGNGTVFTINAHRTGIKISEYRGVYFYSLDTTNVDVKFNIIISENNSNKILINNYNFGEIKPFNRYYIDCISDTIDVGPNYLNKFFIAKNIGFVKKYCFTGSNMERKETKYILIEYKIK